MLLTLFLPGLLLMLLLCCGPRSGLLLTLFGVKLLLMLLLRLTLGLLLTLLLGLILILLLMAFLGLTLRLLDLPGRTSTKSGCRSVLLFDLVSDSIPLLRTIPFSLGDSPSRGTISVATSSFKRRAVASSSIAEGVCFAADT